MGSDVADWISRTSRNGEVARLSLPEGVDNFLEDVKFGFHVQLSLIEQVVFQQKLYFIGTATADFASLGNFDFRSGAEVQLPEVNGITAFIQDPLSDLRARMSFPGTVTLPTFGLISLGQATFDGLIKTVPVSSFHMTADIKVVIQGFNLDFQVSIIAGNGSSGLHASLSGIGNIGNLGTVELLGMLSSDITKGLSVKGIVNLRLLCGSCGGIQVL